MWDDFSTGDSPATSSVQTPQQPRLHTFITSTAQNAPQLLRQMEMMMGSSWGDDTHAAATPVMDTQRVEACRSVLALFTSASGVYREILGTIFRFLFKRMEEQSNRLNALDAGSWAHPEGASPSRTPQATGTIGPPMSADQAAARCEFAHSRVKQAEKNVRSISEAARSEKESYEAQISTLQAELRQVKELLMYQASKERRNRLEAEDSWETRVRQTIQGLELEKRVDSLTAQLNEANAQVTDLTASNLDLLELNGRYARQAVELAVRVKIFSDHNEKFATLLALQYDERQNVERENELLRAELVEMNKFHQVRNNLEGEVGTITNEVVLRSVRFGLGSNPTVPRHLSFCGLLNRNLIHRDAALSLVSDILLNRHSQGTARGDFQTAIHNFLTKKYGGDAIMWAYSLDEACRLYDADVNLTAFHLVSHRLINEQVFQDIHDDVSIFLEACEIVDELQHGDVKLTVPVVHIFGILLEMFPGYHDSAFRKIMEQLQTTLTTNAYAHYPMLFPNREREAISYGDAMHGHIERRSENGFSAMFKELIVDDAVVTNQQIEDAIWHVPGDRLTIEEVVAAVDALFDEYESESASAVVSRALKEHQQRDKDSLDGTLSKPAIISTIRTKCFIRRGVFVPHGGVQVQKKSHLASQAVNEWTVITGENLLPIDYSGVLAGTKTQRPKIAERDEDALNDDADA